MVIKDGAGEFLHIVPINIYYFDVKVNLVNTMNHFTIIKLLFAGHVDMLLT